VKFFIDTANVEAIKKAHDLGLCDGVTTNPTLVAKEGRDFKEVIQEISKIVDGPVSAEAMSEDAEGMKAVKVLSRENIKTNVTLVFSANQALIAAKAGATFVSPFIGRLDDIGHDGMQIIRDIMQIYDKCGFKTEVIVASIRHPLHVIESAKLGAHIATIPPNVIDKMMKHTLTDIGIKNFLADYAKIPKKE